MASCTPSRRLHACGGLSFDQHVRTMEHSGGDTLNKYMETSVRPIPSSEPPQPLVRT